VVGPHVRRLLVFLTLAIALMYRILPDAKMPGAMCGSGGSSGLLLLLGNHMIGWYLAAAGVARYMGPRFDLVVMLWSTIPHRSFCLARNSHGSMPSTAVRPWNRKRTRCASAAGGRMPPTPSHDSTCFEGPPKHQDRTTLNTCSERENTGLTQ